MEITNKFYNWLTHGMSVVGILTFQDFKSVILFIGSIALIIMQLRLYHLKIKNEKKENK
jgi:hypothetical protein